MIHLGRFGWWRVQTQTIVNCGGRAIQISEVIKIGGGLLRVKLLQNRWRDLALAVRQLKCRCKCDVTQVIHLAQDSR